MSRHHIVLITGLGSSLPVIGAIWTAWARKMEKRFRKHYRGRKDVTVTRVSADLTGEARALDLLRKDIRSGQAGRICIAGHSNGFRDGLLIAEALRPYPVAYFAGIDMTLGDGNAKVTGNIKLLHEFHAVLGWAKIGDSFKKTAATYRDWQINKGHTRAASDRLVQDTIFRTMVETIG